MKYQINTRKSGGNKETEEKIKNYILAIMFVFSISFVTLLFLFSSSQLSSKITYGEEDEIKEVFKETAIYDFLDLDMCKNEKMSGEVSDFDGKIEG